ncbi:MAG TPA: iron ABC transporter permease [Acidimicrobiia bacterium]|nr:iron ABC transporter permease [Acidimicrobiia bacterium]
MGVIAPPPDRTRASSTRPTRSLGWWIAASVVLIPALVPPISLAIQVLLSGTGLIFPTSRLIELLAATLGLAVAVTITSLSIGTITAWLTTRTDLRGRNTWMVLAALPLVIPSYMAALTVIGATGNNGLLAAIGLTIPTPYGFWGAWLALSLFLAPLAHLTIIPGLRAIDPAIEDAGVGLGASRWRVFWTITLPQLRPSLVSAALMIGLYTLSDFGAVSLLRYDTFTRAIYTLYAGQIDRRPAATLSLILMALALTVLTIEWSTRRRAGYRSSSTKRGRRLVVLRGPGRFVSIGFLGSLTAISLLLPVSVLIYWLVRGLRLGNELGSLWDEVGRTLGIALAAAAVTVVAAFPLAMVTTWKRRRMSTTYESVAWGAYSLPHITVGVAVIAFVLRSAPIVYQTAALLLLVYMGMFLAQAMSPIQDSLRRASPDLEDASRGLGRGQLTTLRRITLPITTPGLLAAATLVFISVMKELPATLLLRPNGFETLAIRIWSATGEAFYTRASAASLALLAVSIVPLLVMTRRDLNT